jgi:uncharacterized phage protein (TIGR01671 family)
MCEILFRGKRVDNGEWVEGNLITGTWYMDDRPITAISPVDNVFYPHCETSGYEEIIPETVGQYTGIEDVAGRKIFEGDIVRCGTGRICKVVYFTSPSHCGFDLYAVNGFDAPPPIKWKLFTDTEVIGNVYDNPELLEVDNG